MHNPLVLLTPQILGAWITAGHTCFVRQTYRRGMARSATGQKGAYLVTHYRDISHATIHLEALHTDAARFLYNSSDSTEMQKLAIAANQPPGYTIYAALLAEREWRPSADMKRKIKTYIGRYLDWQPGSNGTVNTDLFFQFGELFITLKYRMHEVRIPLSDIEK